MYLEQCLSHGEYLVEAVELRKLTDEAIADSRDSLMLKVIGNQRRNQDTKSLRARHLPLS